MRRRDPLKPIERATTLRTEVYEKVRQAIVDGLLPPGSPLASTELASRLGVSRTPVREAIRRLVHDGLLLEDVNGRIVVRPVPRREIADFFEIRAALEALAARRAVEQAGEDWLERLHEAEQRLEEAVEADASRSRQRELNEAFHDVLFEGSGNRLLRSLVRDLESTTARDLIERLYEQADPQMTVDDHRAIVAAADDGDAERAARAAAEHVERSARYLLRIVDDRSAPAAEEAPA